MPSEKELLLKKWVNDYSDLLYDYSIKRGFDADRAKDLLQETFIAAWRTMENFKGEASVKNWLFVILKNKISDHFRKSANIVVIQSIEQAHNDPVFFDKEDHWAKHAYPKEWSVNFDNRTEVKEFQQQFKNCSSKLKEIQSIVFVRKYVDGFESEDICRELGITSANYWVLIHRAKVQLRACLEKHWLEK
ncbi:MAG: sigma-70 family RNA polymerase sigma factor [Chitinophagaceae bacterium]